MEARKGTGPVRDWERGNAGERDASLAKRRCLGRRLAARGGGWLQVSRGVLAPASDFWHFWCKDWIVVGLSLRWSYRCNPASCPLILCIGTIASLSIILTCSSRVWAFPLSLSISRCWVHPDLRAGGGYWRLRGSGETRRPAVGGPGAGRGGSRS